MGDDQRSLARTRVEPDADAIPDPKDIGCLEIRHVGRYQQVSLAGDGDFQHVPVFLIAQGIHAAANKRVRMIAGRSERCRTANGADQGFGLIRVNLELPCQDECQALEHAEGDHQL